MVNNILNVAGTGGWVPVNLPRHTKQASIQARTNVISYYRYRGQTNFWTIKADTSVTVTGDLFPTDIEVQSAIGTVMEVEVSTYSLNGRP